MSKGKGDSTERVQPEAKENPSRENVNRRSQENTLSP